MAAEIVGTLVFVVGHEDATGLGVKQFIHGGPGTFTILFDFPVIDTCVEIASIAHADTAGWITAYGDPPLGQDAVSVRTGTWALEGTEHGILWSTPLEDLTFQLLVVQPVALQ